METGDVNLVSCVGLNSDLYKYPVGLGLSNKIQLEEYYKWTHIHPNQILLQMVAQSCCEVTIF